MEDYPADGMLFISKKIVTCPLSKLVTCTSSIKIVYLFESQKTTVEIFADNVFINGDSSVILPYNNQQVIVKRATSLFYKVKSKGFEVLYDPNGRIYIKLLPTFTSKVSGIIKGDVQCRDLLALCRNLSEKL